jgi:hypothetical protein
VGQFSTVGVGHFYPGANTSPAARDSLALAAEVVGPSPFSTLIASCVWKWGRRSVFNHLVGRSSSGANTGQVAPAVLQRRSPTRWQLPEVRQTQGT